MILEADHDLNNLIAQYFQPRIIADNGEGGLGKGMDGRAGKDLVVKVPCGTLVWHQNVPDRAAAAPPVAPFYVPPDAPPMLPAATSERPLIRHSGSARAIEVDFELEAAKAAKALKPPPAARAAELVADLTEHGQQFVLCRGGRGGLGNRNFATSRRQTPRFAQPGEPGDEGEYLLELRMMADVGLVGYPNAGKSTLLAAISHARPKIAAYPFTTLHPQIGIVEYPDWRRLMVCDVPGLIEGAHQNIGLGHGFLRHIQRCKVLILLLDMAGTDGRHPWDDHKALLNELGLYAPALLEKPRLVVANKMDEPASAANLAAFKRRVKKTKVLSISAAFDQGMETFRAAIRAAVEIKKSSVISHQ